MKYRVPSSFFRPLLHPLLHPLMVIVLMSIAVLGVSGCSGSSSDDGEMSDGGGEQPVREVISTDEITSTTSQTSQSLTTPHPILSDQRVRQAIAYCTDRSELIRAVYPFLDDAQRQKMMMDTFIPQGHWALATEGITRYPFNPEQGNRLLEEAGWTMQPDKPIRMNADGELLSLEFTTTDADFRQKWATVFEQQLLNNCGIEIVRTHAPGSWWFGGETGLQRRDFELGAYAWVGQTDPAGDTLYACNQIPLPENNWEGQNYMGWCNERASQAIIAANNTLKREERKKFYAIAQQEFTKDMVSLPLFNRFEAAAASNNLQNFKPDVSESSYVVNIDEWRLTNGGDTVVIGFSQEPSTLFAVAESSSVTQIVVDLLSVRAATGRGYDYQPVALTRLPTLENGGATMEMVEVTAGDIVWTAKGERAPLEPGTQIIDANNQFITYEGGTITLPQLKVTFELTNGLTWEDGVPVTAADIQLAHDINCDRDSGGVSYLVCDAQQQFEVLSDTSFAYTYLPGARLPQYMVATPGVYAGTSFTVGAYPAHQTLSDGRKLADVPAAEWSTLPEISEQLMSYGPYKIVEWQKGQRMVFEANPHYYLGEPPIKRVIVEFFSDTNAVVAQLLTGNVDVVGTETLGAGEALGTVLEAGAEGKIQAFPLTSSTWEHVDMNLYKK